LRRPLDAQLASFADALKLLLFGRSHTALMTAVGRRRRQFAVIFMGTLVA